MARDLMERYPNVLRWNFKNEGLGIISEACRVHDSDENTFYKHLSGKPRAFKSRSFEEFVARNDFLVNFMINALFNTDERYGFLSEVESRFDNAHEKP
ncbi:MAG: hypothetical protein HZB66_03220, partial [Candidatus Aenigmarchaeota archaeon]|nr:hypothetical protein [Candidatus Aenigmarchaeota archaeon]